MRLELRQKQKQILTEKMIQSVEILQMTSQELKEYVNEVMLENPVVELDEHVKENTGTEDKTGKLGETEHRAAKYNLVKSGKSNSSTSKRFFEHGSAYLKPYRLADAAEEIGIHESTVSRAVNKKYLQCSQGIFPLSYFFVRGMQENAEQSSAAIKGMIRELIRQENKKKPHSDAIITKLLNEKGIQISRRTIAKYRDQEGIPGASGRKDWKQDSVV